MQEEGIEQVDKSYYLRHDLIERLYDEHEGSGMIGCLLQERNLDG